MTMYRSLLSLMLFFVSYEAGLHAQDAPVTPPGLLDVRQQAPITGHAQAGAGKAAVCGACHGPKGIAIAPNFPNLAGQSATYLYVQLKEFKQGHRSDPVMNGQAATLSDEDMHDLAAYYASLAPKSAAKADASTRGGQLYLSGDSSKGIPPCQGCHGPAGQGPLADASAMVPSVGVAYPAWATYPKVAWSAFPRLGGQSSLYLGKALGDYKSGARSGSTHAKVMNGVASTLSDDDVQAISGYIETL